MQLTTNKNKVTNFSGFQHKSPFYSDLRYPPTAKLQTWTNRRFYDF